MSLSLMLFGKPKGCQCADPHQHRRGDCPERCLCERCACTCTWACSLGGSLDRRFAGCRCGCIHHHKA